MRSLVTITSFLLWVHTAEALDFWATHGMERVKRTASARPLLEPMIHAARGEWEPLQVVATGNAAELQALKIEASPLRGMTSKLRAEIIAAPVILREHYVPVTKSSELSPYPPSEYPDALVPLSFPQQPITAGGEVHQPFWLDVYVPPNAQPGMYAGTVTITTPLGMAKQLHYQLEVWDFALPEHPAMATSMFIVWRRIAEIHGFEHESGTASPQLQHVLDDYYDMLVSHRLSPHEVWATYPNASDPMGDESFSAIERGLKDHLLKRNAGRIGLPLWETWPLDDPLQKDRQAALDYTARYYRVCEKIGCAGRLYKIFGELDEPHTAEAYAKVRAWKAFFDELKASRGISIPLLITVQPMDQNEALVQVSRHADILSPHVSALWMDVEGNGAAGLTQRHLQADGELWTYTALVQAPDEWKVAQGHPKKLLESHPPTWLTDYPAIHHRLLAWLAPRYGVTGFTYWDTSHFPAEGFDPWNNNGTYPHSNGDVYNGDGFFIYPAHQQPHGYEGPVASIRLKWLRECVDDYDYLHLMMEAGQKKQALQRASTFVRGLCDWEDDIAALYAAREDIGRHLERLAKLKQQP